MDRRAADILKKKRLSVTENRMKILRLFLSKPGALAHHDIEYGYGEKFDRVTVYRTLQVFVEKGIIHTIPTPDNLVRYALCREDCSDGHRDHHIHFVCTRCSNTYCLDDIVTPEIKLPKGYQAAHVEVLVDGVCKNCK